jgi:hypothetical protein
MEEVPEWYRTQDRRMVLIHAPEWHQGPVGWVCEKQILVTVVVLHPFFRNHTPSVSDRQFKG